MFRDAFKRHRWITAASGKRPGGRQPYYISATDGGRGVNKTGTGDDGATLLEEVAG